MKRTLALLLATATLARADVTGNDHALDDAFQAEIAALLPQRAAPVPHLVSPPGPVHVQGSWSDVIQWTPHVPVTGALLPDGRLLTFASNQRNAFPGGPEFTYAAVWDPATGQFTEINNNRHDMFCAGVAMLPDGRVIASGGRTCNRWSSIFDWRTNRWLAIQDMNDGRWYNSSLTLRNGDVFTASGTNGERTTERWNPATGWKRFTGIDWQVVLNDPGFDKRWHPFLSLAPDGRIFHHGPTSRMHWVTPTGNGTITNAGVTVPGEHFPKEGAWAMYNEGRILISGGFGSPSGGAATKLAFTVDITGATPVVTPTAQMANERTFANAVILPNGEVMVIGGNRDGVKFNDNTAVFDTEIWNPATGQWRITAPISVARTYHSLALLLPDGRVWSGGGGLADNPIVDHPDAQVYSPATLFKTDGSPAVRPQISAAPDRIGPGVPFTVEATPGVQRFTFIRLSSQTHSVSTDLRFLEFPVNELAPGRYQLTSHSNLNVLVPGYWMLFALDASGTHSVSKIIQVLAGPVVANPGPQTSNVGSVVSLQINADVSGGQPLSFAASGLPPGLAIQQTSGTISGSPTTVGSYDVNVTVTDGVNSPYTISFPWTVSSALFVTAPASPPKPAGTSISLTATGGGGSGLTYKWNFGDGSPETAFSSSASTAHTFTAPGRYLVTVTVRDSSGRESAASLYQAAHAPLGTNKPAMSSAITYDGANNRVWVANPDNDTVTVLNAATRARLAEPAVAAGPRTLAIAPDGRVWVACMEAARITVLHPSTFATAATFALPRGSRPFGVAFSPDGSAAWVACEGSGLLYKMNPSTGAVIATIAVGPDVRHVSVTPDSARVLVSRFITPPLPGEDSATPQTTGRGGEIVVVNATTNTVPGTAILQHSERVDSQTAARGIPNYLGAAAISPDGLSAWIPSKQDNIKRGIRRNGIPLSHDHTIRAVASRLDLTSLTESQADRLDFDNGGMPSAAVYDPFGIYVYVALEASREVAICDTWNRRVIQRFDVERAPQGLTLSPDGRTLFVHNFMSRTVSVHDVSGILNGSELPVGTTATVATIATERLSPQVLLGKQHFYDALDPRISLESYISCASCHNDGDQDGRVWDMTGFGEGLRNTITLRGRSGMGHGPLHWSGNFDEVQDFENQIRSLNAGSGFMSNADFAATGAPLGTPKAGRSADLDALAAYVSSLQATPASPHRNADGSLTADAALGGEIFRTLNCAQCHGGTAFTDSAPGNLRDIGTLRASSGSRLGGPLGGIDSPSLRGVWATAPYLHDGRAATIGDAIAMHAGISLNATDLARLVAFVQQIDDAPATAPLPAPGASLLADDFNDNVRDALKWNVGAILGTIYSGASAFDPAMTVAERNQRLEVVLRANVTGDHYAGFVSAGTFNFTGAAASVRVAQAAGGTADTLFCVSRDSQNFALMVVEGGTLYADHVANGSRSFSTHSYSATQDRFWRIRHSPGTPGTIAFETSANGATWRTLRAENARFALNAVRVELGAGTFRSEAAPGTAVFDDFLLTNSVTQPTVNQPPVARPGGPYASATGVAVAFTGAASADSDGTIAGYAWNFGDGTTGTGISPSKTYAGAGTFTVTLTVTDDDGATHSASTTATISAPGNQPPVARPGGPYTGTSGTAVAFIGAASSDSDGTITSYAWNFGDGTTGTGISPSKAYAATGTFTVTLTVTDDDGAAHSASTTTTISAPVNQPPVARPGGPYAGNPGAPITFNGSTSSDPDGTITSYEWRMGDSTRQVSVLTDDFGNNVRDGTKWSVGAVFGTIYAGASGFDPGVTVAERNQRLEIVPRTNAGGDRYGGYVSAGTFDFTGSAASVEVPQVAGGDADTLLCVSKDAANCALIVAEGGGLYFIVVNGGVLSVAGTPYDPVQHRYWRIRDGTGSFVFETSATGFEWAAMHSAPAGFTVAAVRIEFGAGTWKPEAAPGMAVFDNFQLTRAVPAAETVRSGANVSHAYPVPGTYTIRLKVTDNSGATHEATTTASVGVASGSLAGVTPISREFAGPQSGDQPVVTVPPASSALRGKWTSISDATFASRLVVQVAGGRRYTAVLRTGAWTHHFAGRLSIAGTTSVVIKRGGTLLQVQIALAPTINKLRGGLHHEALLVELNGDKALFTSAANPVSPFENVPADWLGNFPLTLSSDTETKPAPLKITRDGNALFTARSGGVLFTASAPLSPDGRIPIFAKAQSRVLVGWLEFSGGIPAGTLQLLRAGGSVETLEAR